MPWKFGFPLRRPASAPYIHPPFFEFFRFPPTRGNKGGDPNYGYPNLEVFLRKIEDELFKVIEIPLKYFNLIKEEWPAIRSLTDDRSIAIKTEGKDSSIVI